MSRWGTLEARFEGCCGISAHEVKEAGLPTGSESGARVAVDADGRTVVVEGRLRDVTDFDSPAALAWFLRVTDVSVCAVAALLWEIDDGPRYRYEWAGGKLTKLRGILD